MLFTSIYRKKINAAEALIPLVAFNFKTYLILINFHLLFHLHESTMPNRIKHCFIKFIFFLSQFIFQQFLCLALNPLQSIIHRLGAFSEKLCDFPVIRSHQVQFQHMILQRT